MSEKNQITHPSVSNKPWDLSYADRQKLKDGFEVLVRIIAKQMTGKSVTPVQMPKIIAKEELKTNASTPGIVPPTKEKIVLS
jgi:hypothetical protein